MAVRKVGKQYKVDVRDANGKRYRYAFLRKSDADAYHAKMLADAQLDRRLPGHRVVPIKMRELVGDYLTRHAPTTRYAADLKTLTAHILARFTGWAHIISQSDVINWRNDMQLLGLAHNTINNRIKALSGLMRWAMQHKHVLSNPAVGVRGLRPVARNRALSDSEQSALLKAAAAGPQYIYDVVQLILLTGLRRHEALALTVNAYDSFERTMTVIGKGRKLRVIELMHAANDLMQRLCSGKKHDAPVIVHKGKRLGSVRRSFNAVVRVAGLTDVGLHDLRRTCGGNWATAGVPLEVIQDWMGHSSIETTRKHYVQVIASARKRAIIKKLDDTKNN